MFLSLVDHLSLNSQGAMQEPIMHKRNCYDSVYRYLDSYPKPIPTKQAPTYYTLFHRIGRSQDCPVSLNPKP